MVTTQDEQAIKQFLSSIVEGDLSVLIDEDFGLCYNLHRYVYAQQVTTHYIDGYSFINEACGSWEHFSGSRIYPVHSAALLGSAVYYEGEQLELRQSLSQHLLDTFEEFKHVLGRVAGV